VLCMVVIKNRHRLKNKEIKLLVDVLSKSFSHMFFSETDAIETGMVGPQSVVVVNGHVDFMMYESRLFFTVRGINRFNPEEKCVVVDMGAVPFVVNGADIMSPGVVDADVGILEGDQVWVCDVMHRKPLAVGIALMSGVDMVELKTGKAIKNLHYVGDELWKATVE
jgi:PUA-domain protein